MEVREVVTDINAQIARVWQSFWEGVDEKILELLDVLPEMILWGMLGGLIVSSLLMLWRKRSHHPT